MKKIEISKKNYKRIVIFLLVILAITSSYMIRGLLKYKKSVQSQVSTEKGQSYMQEKYNNSLYEDVEDVYKDNGSKVAYLTFDDGPSTKVTPQILDILKENNIKATFFILGREAEVNPDILKREFEEGHSIGNHSYSHKYKEIYRSPEILLEDIEKNQELLKSILGEEFNTRLVRCPGGTGGLRKELVNILEENEYCSLDWNCLSGDAESMNVSKETLIRNIKKYSKGKDKIVILMHDTNLMKNTAATLQTVIDYLKEEGYEFKAIK